MTRPHDPVAVASIPAQPGVASSMNSIKSGSGIPDPAKAHESKLKDPKKHDPEDLPPKSNVSVPYIIVRLGTHHVGLTFDQMKEAFVKVKMGGFVVLGACLAIAHHFFYRSLAGRRSTPKEFSFLKYTIPFPWAITIGNSFAWIIQTLLTVSIGEVISQRFWHLLHEKSIKLKNMDGVYDIKSAFWHPRILFCATGLSILAAILPAMSYTIGSFASPALSVGPQPLSGICSISTVDLGGSELIVAGGSATPALIQLAIRTLESGSYLPPLPSPCGNCTYNVTYTAPALQCSHINISSSPFLNDSVTDTVLWNSSLGPDPSGVGSEPEIVSCKALNATYYANVGYITGAVVNTTVQIIPNVDGPTGEVTVQQTAFSAMIQALNVAIQGTLVDSSGNISERSLVAYSPLGNFSPQSWTINGDLGTVLSMLVQNISIGLLAKSVAADSTSSTLSSLSDGQCMVETIVYQYDHVRLLSTYGVGFLVTAICAAFGIQSQLSGNGGSMSFNSMMIATDRLNKDDLPLAVRAVKGRFEFAPADQPSVIVQMPPVNLSSDHGADNICCRARKSRLIRGRSAHGPTQRHGILAI
ncbi:hypothetical protein BD410DRAFT_792906 [Rickenella mellea]|uniref:Uncharacterized protein n=1 Tax=Rickenella mellea TaxID=50990 RepID=A0A4Y7PUG0_9AGAM|nr:hypothetical protein BD410DRAFT_792906 [Rickenella mellea]